MIDNGSCGSSLFHNRGDADNGSVPMDTNKKDCLLIGVFQGQAGAKNRHDDHSLAKIRSIAQTKLAGDPAFRRGRWSEFLKRLFWLCQGRSRGVWRLTVRLFPGAIRRKKKILQIPEGDVSPYSLIQPSNGKGD